MAKSFTIHDLPQEERPRERLAKFGEQALSAQELLQLILGRGIAGESVTVTAQKLLAQFGSLQKLAEASIGELSSIRGIGLAKAAQIKAAVEMGRRISTQTPAYKKKELLNPEKVFKLVRSKLKDYSKEHFYLIALDSRNWSIHEVSLGTLNAASFIREKRLPKPSKIKPRQSSSPTITPPVTPNHQKTIWKSQKD